MNYSEVVRNEQNTLANNIGVFAPIALFVYNRISHSRLTIEALAKNVLASESDLVIFSDAPKSAAHMDAVSEVRRYIRDVEGFKSITLIEREENFGLARSISEGVTSLVNDYGRVIVLEDDLVTSPHFLTYMNEALVAYKDDERVMHISGYMYPIDAAGLPETFFLTTTSCWGWATWKRAWVHFHKDPNELLNQYSAKDIHNFNMDGAYNFWSQVQQNAAGLINTWAVFWYASVFELKGLCLHPTNSMVRNIGHDGTGEHCTKNDDFYTNLASTPIKNFEENIAVNALAYERTKNFLHSLKPSIFKRIMRRLKLA